MFELNYDHNYYSLVVRQSVSFADLETSSYYSQVPPSKLNWSCSHPLRHITTPLPSAKTSLKLKRCNHIRCRTETSSVVFQTLSLYKHPRTFASIFRANLLPPLTLWTNIVRRGISAKRNKNECVITVTV